MNNTNPKMLEIDHHYGQYERFFPLTTYHKYILSSCVKIGEVKDGMSVLDYGCGRQMLHHALPKVEYTGYDIVPEFSDVDNIAKSSYDIIFAIQVLQYINQTGINQLADLFSQLSKTLIVMIPTQNKFKYFLDLIMKLQKGNEVFILKAKEIYKLLDHYFLCEKVKSVFGVSEISRWKIR